MPSTTACPYLPGQTVNTMAVPSQKSLRYRSASLSSMRITDYQAVDPQAKFISPTPAPQALPEPAEIRKRSAPGFLRQAASSRSLSPAPAWRRLFGHKGHNDDRGRSRERDDQSVASLSTCENRSAASSRSRNRSISPESLRRFLSDDIPSRPGSNLSERPTLIIPEDIAEENEDDDNFVTSATSESQSYFTGLSAPPARRSPTPESAPLTIKNLSSLTINSERPSSKPQALAGEAPILEPVSHPHSSNLTWTTSSAMASPLSATTPDDESLTFYVDKDDDDVDDDDDDEPAHHEQPKRAQLTLQPKFTGYGLPRHGDEGAKAMVEATPTFGGSFRHQLVATPAPGSKFLPIPVDTGVDSFASELDLMVHTIGTKDD